MIEDRADLSNAIALNSLMVNASRILGPSIGGVLIAAVGEGWCFLVDAISYLAVIASLLAMRVPRDLRGPTETRVLEELRTGLRYVTGFAPIRTVLILLALVAVAYCVVEGVEAVGLWMQRRWAEYLTALATAGFLPLEIHEIAARVTVARIVTLIVNIAILLYLLWAKRLFGIRGGPKAEREEGRIDPEEVFGPAHGKEAKAAVRATEA